MHLAQSLTRMSQEVIWNDTLKAYFLCEVWMRFYLGFVTWCDSFNLQLSFASGVLSVAKSAASVLWNHFVKEREMYEENANIQTAGSDLCISLQRLVLTLNNSRFIYFLILLIYTYKSPLSFNSHEWLRQKFSPQ